MSDFDHVEAAMICWLKESYDDGYPAVSWLELLNGLASETTDHRLIARVQAHLRTRKLLVLGTRDGRSPSWGYLLCPGQRSEGVGFDCVVLSAIRDAAIPQTPAAAAPIVSLGPPAPQYVKLDQIAALLQLNKRTLERWKTRDRLPSPDIEGGGGRADQWIWGTIRPVLEVITNRTLPERFPSLT